MSMAETLRIARAFRSKCSVLFALSGRNQSPCPYACPASDWAEGGLTLEDLGRTAQLFKDAGVDIIHASSGETVKWQKASIW